MNYRRPAEPEGFATLTVVVVGVIGVAVGLLGALIVVASTTVVSPVEKQLRSDLAMVSQDLEVARASLASAKRKPVPRSTKPRFKTTRAEFEELVTSIRLANPQWSNWSRGRWTDPFSTDVGVGSSIEERSSGVTFSLVGESSDVVDFVKIEVDLDEPTSARAVRAISVMVLAVAALAPSPDGQKHLMGWLIEAVGVSADSGLSTYRPWIRGTDVGRMILMRDGTKVIIIVRPGP